MGVQIGEELAGQDDVVVARGLRGERVEGAVAVGDEDIGASWQPQGCSELVGGAVQLRELSLGELHCGSAGRRPLHLADDDECWHHEQQRDERAADRVGLRRVLQRLGQERHDDGGPQDRQDDRDVQEDHHGEEGDFRGVADAPRQACHDRFVT